MIFFFFGGFGRSYEFSLNADESKVVPFQLTPENLSIVNKEAVLIEPKDKISISIDGSQPDEKK
jgi:beta-glucosidase